MTGVEVFSLQMIVAGFPLLQVLQIWPLWIAMGQKVGMVFRSFLPMSNSAGEYPFDKGV